jgi:hypothetical protein
MHPHPRHAHHALPAKGAERRKKRALAIGPPGDGRGHPARVRGVLPSRCDPGRRASRRSAAALFGPGPCFRGARTPKPSASSWREVRSDLQMEPLISGLPEISLDPCASRQQPTCVPPGSGMPAGSRGPHPAPLKRCLAKAPFSEQDGQGIGLSANPSEGLF